jgi:hypothetical protein
MAVGDRQEAGFAEAPAPIVGVIAHGGLYLERVGAAHHRRMKGNRPFW